MKRFSSLLLTLTLLLGLTACAGDVSPVIITTGGGDSQSESMILPEASNDSAYSVLPGDGSSSSEADTGFVPIQGEYYYDLESVVLYLDTYGDLPMNYITKTEAQELGWTGGSVEQYLAGAAIGGDSFGNREGLLPKEQGRKYTECDLNTDGQDSRGAERLVFSNDGLYFYTGDHYETFTEVWVEDGAVVWR